MPWLRYSVFAYVESYGALDNAETSETFLETLERTGSLSTEDGSMYGPLRFQVPATSNSFAAWSPGSARWAAREISFTSECTNMDTKKDAEGHRRNAHKDAHEDVHENARAVSHKNSFVSEHQRCCRRSPRPSLRPGKVRGGHRSRAATVTHASPSHTHTHRHTQYVNTYLYTYVYMYIRMLYIYIYISYIYIYMYTSL